MTVPLDDAAKDIFIVREAGVFWRELNKREKMVARYHEIERKPPQPLAPLEVEQRYLEAQNELSAVRGVIGTLRSKFDYLDEPLARVLRLTDDE